MPRLRLGVAFAVLGLALGAAGSRTARHLTFEQRVEAQAAIERVYYSHQTGRTRSFEEKVPRTLLEGRVRGYLRLSAALENYWHTPITAKALQRELERIARDTRFPDRVRELYAALGNDAFVIQETLARRTLVDRLARSFFAGDERIHGGARRRALRLYEQLAHGEIDISPDAPRRVVVEVERGVGPSRSRLRHDLFPVFYDDRTEQGSQTLPPEEFESFRRRLPETVGEPGMVKDESNAFVVPVVLDDAVDRLRVAYYLLDKRRWEDWWEQAEATFDESSVATVASPGIVLPEPGARLEGRVEFDLGCIPDHRWDNGSLDAFPDPPSDLKSVWTGSEMVVWGPKLLSRTQTVGWRYDPLIDAWSPMSDVGAPTLRVGWGMVWTGAHFVVWGGLDQNGNEPFLGDGARYDPVSNTWTPMSMLNAPQPRSHHMMVWTGREIVVWGGFGINEIGRVLPLANGGRYDPTSDTWEPITTLGAPTARHSAPAVWVDPYVVLWGGKEEPSNVLLDTGGRYDPRLDVWLPVSPAGAPASRFGHRAVSTGSSMIVWGGEDGADQLLDTGGRYDPVADSWQPTSISGAPSPREAYGIIWTGSQMVIWGGVDRMSPLPLSTGGRYDPLTDEWSLTQLLNAPAGGVSASAVWTGSLMLIWPAVDPVLAGFYMVGRYDPGADAWTLAPVGKGPTPRSGHSAVWTGNLMLVWGGVARPFTFLSDGASYDPALDTWTGISAIGGPEPQLSTPTVWTGEEMIVWAASAPNGPRRGGRYDPLQDAWRPMSSDNSPPPQIATGVWTGQRMVVWGSGGPGPTGRGGQYDPKADAWLSVSTQGAPSLRSGHAAVWAGNQMVVWGGFFGGANLSTGGRYDPVADAWTTTSTADAPSERERASVVWTGSEMIVWGGEVRKPPFYLDTGGRYDPATDSWTPTQTLEAPSARRAIGVWTGDLMLVWGGRSGAGVLDTGGAYDPVRDSWLPLPMSNAPLGRDGHSTVWTGNEMLVWGGSVGFADLKTGGRYVPGNLVDADGDSFRGCDGDCDDNDPDVNPAAAEECNGRDDNCDGVVPPEEAEVDGDGFAACAGDCDDGDPSVNPSATELPGNTRDENCDGILACDPRAEWETHGRFVKCVERECRRLVAAGLVTAQKCAASVAKAGWLRPAMSKANGPGRAATPGNPTPPTSSTHLPSP